MMALSPKETGIFIAKNSTYVTLSKDGIKKLAYEVFKAVKDRTLTIDGFSQVALHPKKANETAVQWIFLVDTLNFCFWKPAESNEHWEVTFHGKSYSGYFALCAAINKAVEEGIPIMDVNYISTIQLSDLQRILRSDTSQNVPLLEERLACLHEVGNILLEKFDGSFVNCIKESKHSAQNLLKIIVDNFPCFRDEGDYKGQRVSFYKRAQILIGDIWACFRGEGLGHFTDIDTLVMFADYRIPQVLVHFGAMIYNEELMTKLKMKKILENKSVEEMEIRGCSIEAVEQVKAVVITYAAQERVDISINSILIDHFLWDYRRQHAESLDSIPFHRVKSIYY